MSDRRISFSAIVDRRYRFDRRSLATSMESRARDESVPAFKFADWKRLIPGDILALQFGEVAEWLKAALC
jgi:hypothetical protein